MAWWLNLLVVASYLTVVAFALIAGKRAERSGAAIIGGGLLLTWLAQALAGVLSHGSSVGVPLEAFMLIDLLVTLALGVVMLKFPEKLWPGLAGCAQFLVFIFSVTRVIDFPLSEQTFLIAVNLSSAGVLLALLGGTWAARWYQKPVSDWDQAAASLSPAST